MIEVDISNIWGELSLPDLLGIEAEIFAAHRAVTAAPEEYGLDPTDADRDFDLYSYENPVWLYTAARKLLSRLGRTHERVEYRGPAGEALSQWCPPAQESAAGEPAFITLICGGLPGDAAAGEAEYLARDGEPVITLNLESVDAKTPELLQRFFRLSQAILDFLG